MKIVTAAEMREIDQRSIEAFHIPSLLLMEHAALQVVEVLEKRFAPLSKKIISVVCGKGNNGGDGLAVARILSVLHGAQVTVWLSADPALFKSEVVLNYKMARAAGVVFRAAIDLDLSQAELVIDALFGTGIKGAVVGEVSEIIVKINGSGKPVVSVDVPSGLDCDTGEAPGAVVEAKITVTFGFPKYGLVVYPGASYAGELIVKNIGNLREIAKNSKIKTALTEATDVGQVLPFRVNGRDTNKGSFGHAVAFAGSVGFTGAPILVAEAAGRAGAGLVTLAVPESVQEIVATHVSPVVMPRGLKQSSLGTFSPGSVQTALSLCEKASAVAVGPGIGTDDEVLQFVSSLVGSCKAPLVIDADALNCLSKLHDHGVSAIKSRNATTILTPHPGEMGRLLGVAVKEIEADRKSSVTRAARLFGCVVILKGSRTLIADAGGFLWVNTTGNSGMSTGGMGDALTGVTVALLAQSLAALDAAFAGVYLHGLAGDLAAAALCGSMGTVGLIATDLIAYLPQAISECQRSWLEVNR